MTVQTYHKWIVSLNVDMIMIQVTAIMSMKKGKKVKKLVQKLILQNRRTNYLLIKAVISSHLHLLKLILTMKIIVSSKRILVVIPLPNNHLKYLKAILIMMNMNVYKRLLISEDLFVMKLRIWRKNKQALNLVATKRYQHTDSILTKNLQLWQV